MKHLKAAACCAALFLAPTHSRAGTDDYLEFEQMLGALLQLYAPALSSPQYFEKKGIFGDWDSTVLIYGYPNNRSACETILRAAQVENPSLEFRCRPAQ